MSRRIILFLFSFYFTGSLWSQTCSEPGQNPSTSVGVCGTSVFSQTTVSICGNRVIKGPCTAVPVSDKNPFWYQFTCFAAGTLAFTISPNNLADDYDWQLFDVTGHFDANGHIKNNDVYNDLSLFVSCNWSGEPGLTGTKAGGTGLLNCDGLGVPTFNSMPVLVEGHEYLLLVSHFTDSQSGYSLSFGGGTSSITDPTPPHMKNATSNCDGTKVYIALNKKMKCSSLSSNGSEFTVTPLQASVIAANGIGCADVFSTLDSIELTLNKSLPPGNYTLTINNGVDGNTLSDKCNANIPAGESIPFTIKESPSTSIDSITNTGCAPATLHVVMKTPVKCNSIAADGSDFLITGDPDVSITGASGNCINGFTPVINIILAKPIKQKGNYQLKLVAGSDGNTVENECAKLTADTTINFTTSDTVSALFTHTLNVSCEQIFADYFHDGKNGVNKWQWQFDSAGNNIATTQNPQKIYYNIAGTYTTKLTVSNGVCTDTSVESIVIPDKVTAAFEITEILCPGEVAKIKDNSLGNVSVWEWDFGNGKTSTGKSPPDQTYSFLPGGKDYIVQLIVKNAEGCTDTLQKQIRAVNNCYITMPSAFSPNNDGLNDYLYPLNAYKANDLQFRVFNRYGQAIFETSDWTKKWDGSFKGKKQDGGTYIWTLEYVDKDTGKRFNLKGTSILIR